MVALASAVRPFKKPGAETVKQMPGFSGSKSEQLELFGDCALLVAQYGSALHNVLFLPDAAVVLTESGAEARLPFRFFLKHFPKS